MNTNLLTEKELCSQMSSIFTAIFPNRSTTGLEDAISGSPKPRASECQKKEWILEKAKMALLAENKLSPTEDPQELQNGIERIDEMIASISTDYKEKKKRR